MAHPRSAAAGWEEGGAASPSCPRARSTETEWRVWGQPPDSRGGTMTAQRDTTRSFSLLLRELLALEWERRRLLVSTQGSPFAQGKQHFVKALGWLC